MARKGFHKDMTTHKTDVAGAIRRFIEDSSTENAAALQDAMQASSYFLLLDSQTSKDVLDDKSAAPLLQESIPVRISLIEGGGRTLEIFTGRNELPKKATVESLGAAEVSAPILFDLLSSLHQQKRLDSVLFNPDGDAMAFPLEGFLDFFAPAKAAEPAEAEHEFKEDTVLSFSNALESADGTLLRQLRRAGRITPQIEKLWLAAVMQPAPMDVLLVAESTKDDPKILKRVLSEVRSVLKNRRVGLVFSTDPMAADIVSFEPVFARKH